MDSQRKCERFDSSFQPQHINHPLPRQFTQQQPMSSPVDIVNLGRGASLIFNLASFVCFLFLLELRGHDMWRWLELEHLHRMAVSQSNPGAGTVSRELDSDSGLNGTLEFRQSLKLCVGYTMVRDRQQSHGGPSLCLASSRAQL
jgi:hypothetical protein